MQGAATSAAPTTKKSRRPAWLKGDTLIAIIVLLPSIIAVSIFIYGFIVWTGFVSMVKWDSPIVDYSFVGLKNWKQLFTMDRFHWDMRNLVIYAIRFHGPVYRLWLLDCRAAGPADQGRSLVSHHRYLPVRGLGDCHGRRVALADAADDGDQPAVP